MLGPPPDPRALPFPAGLLDAPGAWGWCALLALICAAVAWRWPRARTAAVVVGGTVLLTAPAAGVPGEVWWGAYPTIDKEGSRLFYEDGVHWRLLARPWAAPADPAIRLIGVHLGHLLEVALFDLVLPVAGAFRAVALLHVALAWGAAAGLARALGARPVEALLLGLPIGLNLHLLRDVQYTTVEKSADFVLPLFAWAVVRAGAGGRAVAGPAIVLLGGAFLNLYSVLTIGLGAAVVGAFGLGAFWRGEPSARARGASLLGAALAALLAAAAQAAVQAGGPALASPAAFVWERAALDAFTLVPWSWARLPPAWAWSPVALAVVLGAAWSARRDRAVQACAAAALALFVVGWGPLPAPGVPSPLYLALVDAIPGFWRVAKPEALVVGSRVLLVAAAARALGRRAPLPPRVLLVWGLAEITFVLLSRTHAAWPGFSLDVPASLDPSWRSRP